MAIGNDGGDRAAIGRHGAAHLLCLIRQSGWSWSPFAAWQVALRLAPVAARGVLASLLAMALVLPLPGCASPSPRSIFIQSPQEMLSTALRLYDLDAGTKIDKYGRILGAGFKLTHEDWQHFFPAQRYTLDGSTKNYGVELEIYGLWGTVRDPVTRVLIRMFGLDHLACIRKTDIDALAAEGFQILEPLPIPAPQIGYSVIRPHDPHAPYPRRIMNVSYAGLAPELCVDVIVFDFQPVSDGWGH